MIFLIFLLIIILIFIISKKIIHCKWKVVYKDTYDRNKSYIINKYFELLNKLDIVYFLGFGSELGALRNGGFIRNDHDVDVIIPIWLNYKIFKCNKYIEYYPHKCQIVSDSNTKICKKTRYTYMTIFRNYIQRIMNNTIYFHCKYINRIGYSSCWIMKSGKYFLDIWIFIGNEYFHDNFKICRCKFSNILSYCTVDAIKYAYRYYGENWKIPVKSGSGDNKCYVILYPNSTNSKIKYIF